MSVYYNEIDPFCAQWLRNLIAAGHIAPGDVDERSIQDIVPGDLRGYTQCHFFAGIGLWSYALRLAGWPDGRPCWTGSCPCQPFSAAGAGAGFADERHLWPAWFHLIRECRPPVLFGEQVASASLWLELVHSDLEAVAYAVGAMPIEAACVSEKQYRDRYWFVASTDVECSSEEWIQRSRKLMRPSGNAHDITRPLVSIEGERWRQGRATHAVLKWSNGAAAIASIGDSEVIRCPDGKWRPLPPPGVRWLGNGIPCRVDMLRAEGNSIDPELAAEFVRAYCEARMT